MALSQGEEMTLTFNTPIPSLTQLVVCMKAAFRSQAAIDSENQLFSLFPIEKPKLPNLSLP